MKHTSNFPFYTLIFLWLFSACQDTLEPDPGNTSGPGAIAGDFELGRAIFYDKNLSADNNVSCSSCHQQAFAFTDHLSSSVGIGGNLTSRNSMPLQNIHIGPDLTNNFEDSAKSTPLFWDGREENLFDMVLMPFTDANEHGLSDLSLLVKKMSALPYYKEAFKSVHQSEITSDLVAQSLATFVTRIQSNNTRFDRYQLTGQGLSVMEINGKDLFFDKYDCNACHQVETPSGYLSVADGFANIGLDTEDLGRQNATGRLSDARRFKIPSLRNVVYTAPYMHNGQIQSLDSVIEHYSIGLLPDPNLDSLLQDENGNPLVLSITENEKEAIIAFLGTLSDESVINNPNFASPFEE